jgi:hypothetical protein
MADFERLMDQFAVLKRWSTELPSGVRRAALLPDQTDAVDLQMATGERHGSWFLEMRWELDELVHIAVLAITNPTALPDTTTERVIVTARAGATTDTRYITETVVEQRRAISRMSETDLEAWLLAAVERSRGYSEASLNQAYSTGIGQ